MLCNVKCTACKIWTTFCGGILCKSVKLTEPPDAEPHVRWCERSAAKAASYSIKEEIIKPIIIGQSMGGYVGQAYAQLYPGRLAGFISINSAPLQRNYVTAVEIWLLKRMEPIYAHYTWKLLLKSGTEGVATSGYVRNLMKETFSGFL